MSSQVVVKAILVRRPHEMAKRWSAISGVLYMSFGLYACIHSLVLDERPNWVRTIMFWSFMGAILPMCGYSAASSDNRGQMCLFGYVQIFVAAFYFMSMLFAWDTVSMYSKICRDCVFNNSTQNCYVSGNYVPVTQDECNDVLDMTSFSVLVVWMAIHFLVHVTTCYWTCKAMYYKPSQITWASASIDAQPFDVIAVNPQMHPPLTVDP